MIYRIWQWFWQQIANKHFYNWADTKNPDELKRYSDAIDRKFFYKR
jgi:hypothetical protein